MLSKGYILDKKYEVIRVLGMGGMGTVYLCKNNRLETLWAIKETKKDTNLNIDNTNEPNILKRLNHPGIPKIIDIFYENTNFYMVEEYIEGQTLKEYIKETGCIDVSKICHIVLSICDIIKYLHSFDPPIIYRDAKPANIMITPSGKVVLIDFGISKIYKFNNDSDTVNLGSIGYAAPEQSGLVQSCVQTDIYGIGMVMYFMATGKTSQATSGPLIDGNYTNNTDLDLIKIIQKCVQPQIKDRYNTIHELNDEILNLLNKYSDDKTLLFKNSTIKPGQKTSKSKLRLSLFGMLVVVCIVLLSIHFLSNNKKAITNTNSTSKPTVNTTVPTTKVITPTTKSVTPAVPNVVKPTVNHSTNNTVKDTIKGTIKSAISQNENKLKSHYKKNK